MVELKHAITGHSMWVHESRLEEYLAAGHKPAAEKAVKPQTKPRAKKAKE